MEKIIQNNKQRIIEFFVISRLKFSLFTKRCLLFHAQKMLFMGQRNTL